jgi:hypothetical protein
LIGKGQHIPGRGRQVSELSEVVVAVPRTRSQLTIFDIAKLGVMFLTGFGALKLMEHQSGLVQFGAFVLGFVSIPMVLWVIFIVQVRRKSRGRELR